MQVEVLAGIVDGALRDVANGVVSQLGSVPCFARDRVAEGEVRIVNVLDDEAAIRGQPVDMGGALLLAAAPDGPTRVSPDRIHGEYSFGVTPVVVSVIHRGVADDGAARLRQTYVAMRAVVLALAAYFARRADDGARVINEVTLLRVDGLTYGAVQDDGGGTIGAVAFTVAALDKRAQRKV